MIHQAVKLTDREERESFLDWLWDFEFNKLGLPVPDKVVFLDMNPEVADRLIAAPGRRRRRRRGTSTSATKNTCTAAMRLTRGK